MTRIVLLGDEIELAYGKGLPQRSRIPGDFPVFGSNGRVDTHDRPLIKGPGIIVGRKGSVGEVIWSDEDFWPIDTTYYVKLKDPEDNLRYWYYQLKVLGLNQLNSHSAIPGLNREVAYAKRVIKRQPEEQEKIADILGTIDEKIELNRKMNETLEQMGQALFRHYFIDNPEREKWEVRSLEDISDSIVRGFTAKYADKSDIINLNQKVNKGPILDKQYFKYYAPDTAVPSDKFARPGDILINSLGQGTLGRVHQYSENTTNVVVDQHITIVRSSLSNYLYYRLAYRDNQRLQSMISGTTGMLMLNISKIRTFKLPDPTDDRELLNKFDSIIDSFSEQKNKNNQEIQSLTIIRDTILPRLISGKIALE